MTQKVVPGFRVAWTILGALAVAGCGNAESEEGERQGEAEQSAVFQDGVSPSGYSGTRDTFLREETPSENNGGATPLRADGDSTNGKDLSALLRFELSSIPRDAIVRSVTLTINVENATGGLAYEIYALKRSWVENTSTWANAATGSPWALAGAKSGTDRDWTVLGSVSATAAGKLAITLNAAGVARVQEWIANPATNFGLIISDESNTDGLAFASRESSTASSRPRLAITYDLPSQPVDAGTDTSVGDTASDTGTSDTGSDSGSGSGTFAWRQAGVGGGGFVTGVLVHPNADVAYARTDVGGAYRWDETAGRWIPILDWVTDGGWHGVAGMAVKASDANVLALLVGRGNAMVLYSTDQGRTFTNALTSSQANSIWPGDAVDGNSRDARWGGERIVIGSDGALWVATRGQGLWKGTPSGTTFTWARESVPGTTSTSTVRALTLATDGSVYAAVQDAGIFKRTTAGTWSNTGLNTSGPEDVLRLTASGATIFATTGTYSQTATRAAGKVHRYSGSGSWTDITPTGVTVPDGWAAVSAVGTTVVVVGNLQNRPPIMLSTNNGGSWRNIAPMTNAERTARLLGAPVWWPVLNWVFDHTSNVALDPRRPERLWAADWYGIWRSDEMSVTAPRWNWRGQGHEETIAFHAKGVPGGGVSLGFADVGGFTLGADPSVYPTVDDVVGWSESVESDYARSNPAIRYRTVTSDGSNNAVIRLGTGGTWVRETGYPNRLAYDIAISATNPDSVVATAFGGRPLRRDPATGVWSEIASLGTDDQTPTDMYQRDRPLASDCVDGNTFYMYDRNRLWVSENFGATFAARGDTLSSVAYSSVQCPPGFAGEVWVALGGGGLHRFTSKGAVHNVITGVTDADAIAFGAPLPGTTRPALYLLGNAGAGNGIYVTTLTGTSGTGIGTWKKISDATVPLSKQRSFGASPDVAGRVFFGSSGRGVLYSVLL